MNDAQLRLYRFESSQWRKARKARGVPSREEDRHALHRKILGRDKSSLHLTNAEFDLMLAAFRAESQPENLKTQLGILEGAEKRKSDLMAKARDLAATAGIRLGAEGAYLDGMARRIFKTEQYHLLDEKQLASLCGILQRRKEQLAHKAGMMTEKEPF